MKKAFSLLELAIVMSIFGVMASVLHFHFTNNKPSEAAAAILNDLRYT
ncbi:type II secretion system protein, partial [Campylobacter sp.]